MAQPQSWSKTIGLASPLWPLVLCPLQPIPFLPSLCFLLEAFMARLLFFLGQHGISFVLIRYWSTRRKNKYKKKKKTWWRWEICLLFQLFSCYCFSSSICLSINPNWENTNTRSNQNASFSPVIWALQQKFLLCADWCHYKLTIFKQKCISTLWRNIQLFFFLTSFLFHYPDWLFPKKNFFFLF